VALDAEFHIAGPSGGRVLPGSEFFQLPHVDASRENVLAKDEVLTAMQLPATRK
jgi:xanthine dehydrogenase YagS FAD-binding subunit